MDYSVSSDTDLATAQDDSILALLQPNVHVYNSNKKQQ